MSKIKACKDCHRLVADSNVCPVCKSTNLTEYWRGFVSIIDPEKSEISKELNIEIPGKYAIRLSR
ncbi:MAG: DNA-directed RNA polymerase, subunit E'' [Candidatus Diapherotrites archaeon]|nr:DNA-directed RNA polymerase, subunit E'' [Candidatus Diapherotrites archaeon]